MSLTMKVIHQLENYKKIILPSCIDNINIPYSMDKNNENGLILAYISQSRLQLFSVRQW